jgi:hypothetical protein
MVLAIGCSSTGEKQNMLSAAGFRAVPADSPERQTHLKSLPRDQITPVRRDGTVYYVFPDPKNNILYMGDEQNYQKYHQLRFQRQLADDQLAAAQMWNTAPWGVWGPWGPGWAWRY